jgi:hypothetical protein
MIDVIKEMFLSPFGSFGSVFALFALAFYLVHWITKKITKITTEHNAVCEGHKSVEAKLEKTIGKSESKFDSIRTDIAIIKASLQTSNPLTQSHSPIGLSALGVRVARELSAQEKIEANWDRIEPIINEGTKSKNAYDIQQFCIEKAIVSPEMFFDEKSLEEIKNYAYKEGKPLSNYTNMLGVMIRDEFFKRKGIDVREIDKHDPSNQVNQ